MRATGLVCAILKTIRLFSSELNKPFSPVALASPSLHFIVSTSPHSLDSSPLTLGEPCPTPLVQPSCFLLPPLQCRQSASDFCFCLFVTSRPHLLSKFSPNPLFLRQHLYGPDRWAGYIYSVSVWRPEPHKNTCTPVGCWRDALRAKSLEANT